MTRSPSLVFLLMEKSQLEICVDGKPLTVRHVKVWKLGAGAEFDLKSWTGPEGTAMEADVVDGKMTLTVRMRIEFTNANSAQ